MKLTLQRQIAQLITVRVSGHLLDRQAQYPQWEWSRDRLEPMIRELGIGGVLLFGGSVADVLLRVRQMQSWAKVPLLVCADVEAGVGQRFAGATTFPPVAALSELGEDGVRWARQMGQITASEAVALGLNWLLAPVVDVQSNPDNPVIDVRAFGTDPERVAELISAFIAGAQSEAILTTAKHFPGHGDTGTDPHLALPSLAHSRSRLESLEWVPFQQAISAGVNAIMSAHLMVPDLDPEWPATLSPKILDGVLRQDWHYSGLIVTDAMTMGAMTRLFGDEEVVPSGELAVRAIEAGADIVIMPPDPEASIQAILDAVRQGRLTQRRITESCDRVLKAKQQVCNPAAMSALDPEASVPSPVAASPMAAISSSDRHRISTLAKFAAAEISDLEPVERALQAIGQPESLACAEAIARAAVRGKSAASLPIAPADGWLQWMWTDDLTRAAYAAPGCPAIEAATTYGLPTVRSDLLTPASLLESTLDAASDVVVWIFVQAGPFRGFGGLPPVVQHLLVERLDRVRAIACLGSRGCYDALAEIATPKGIPCLHAVSRGAIAQTEMTRLLWGQAFESAAAIPEC
ncbi:MAG: glycoside hydrolase family 3 N-terminal domain-containing protein [Cyanobacteria bacterium P01_D01_bin.123]